MKSIIEELWYGNIRPQESGFSNSPEIKEAIKSMSKYCSELESTLNDEQKKIFSELMNSRDEFERLYELEIFTYSFKLGARLALEL